MSHTSINVPTISISPTIGINIHNKPSIFWSIEPLMFWFQYFAWTSCTFLTTINVWPSTLTTSAPLDISVMYHETISHTKLWRREVVSCESQIGLSNQATFTTLPSFHLRPCEWVSDGLCWYLLLFHLSIRKPCRRRQHVITRHLARTHS